jgi:hypothetical protein
VPDVVDPEERIRALLSQGEARISRIFTTAIEQLKANLDLELIAELLEQGRYYEALDIVKGVSEQLAQASTLTFISAGVDTAAFLTAADVGRVAFDVINTRALAAMQQTQLDLIRGFTADQQLAVHRVLMNGVQAGLNPIDQARNFRDVVGLTDSQAGAVLNYRRLLEQAGDANLSVGDQREALSRALRDGRFDRTVEAAIRRGQPLTPTQIDRMVQRYSERYVKYRAEVIARTQALRAVHEGTEEAYNQAIDQGMLSPDNLISKWSTHLDGHERDTHHNLNGQTRPFGVPFQTKNGDIRYPGDPNAPAEEVIQCRCLLTRRIKVQ